ncbi:MAG: serine/threonine-protein kinase, partial [Schlesneria sp.]
MSGDDLNYFPDDLKSIFHAALDYPPGAALENYLNIACGANDTLRRRVESLLAARERADDILGSDFHSESDGRLVDSTTDFPERISRYRIEGLLGQGGFGMVYLAFDDELDRRVAIKVPHSQLVTDVDVAEAYRVEARAVANLDHPHIVPVYDVGRTDEFPCFIVSKYIDGTNLAARLKQSRLSIAESVELVASVADALDYAHRHGLVHRDIKPGNLLLDRAGKPYVADFGMALREQDNGRGPRYLGTPLYMSPEQASGEGHRVDGRSDLFSLGVVLYELLVGKRPFQGNSVAETLQLITSFEPGSPRQQDDQIPKELDRICLKALSKRASERYSTAKDMAKDLRSVAGQEARNDSTSFPSTRHPSPTTLASLSQTPSGPFKIVPKGLRSYDAHDADFFLELLPG